jgi:N-methylhydantoinase A/oxoprolinase/acetone carboxylase beta subunit
MNIEEQGGPIYGLGIDPGGTFTDAVIMDLRSNIVLAKAKAHTTHHDLSIGLRNFLDERWDSFRGKAKDLCLVGVSSILATNSILEGKGGKVGLIGLGWTRQEGWDLGVMVQRSLQGGHDVRGRSVSSLDAEGVRSAGTDMMEAVDSVVVSGLFSVHNPYHEGRPAASSQWSSGFRWSWVTS